MHGFEIRDGMLIISGEVGGEVGQSGQFRLEVNEDHARIALGMEDETDFAVTTRASWTRQQSARIVIDHKNGDVVKNAYGACGTLTPIARPGVSNSWSWRTWAGAILGYSYALSATTTDHDLMNAVVAKCAVAPSNAAPTSDRKQISDLRAIIVEIAQAVGVLKETENGTERRFTEDVAPAVAAMRTRIAESAATIAAMTESAKVQQAAILALDQQLGEMTLARDSFATRLRAYEGGLTARDNRINELEEVITEKDRRFERLLEISLAVSS